MRATRFVWALLLAMGLAACGGGGGGGGSGTPDPGDGGSDPTELATGATFQDAMGVGTGAALAKLTANATHLFWFEYDGSLGQSGGRIRSVAQAGGAVTVLASGLGGVNGLAVDATHVYFTEFDLGGGSGSVRRVPVGGGPVETLSSGHFFPTGPAISGTTVYWGVRDGFGSLLQVPKSGGATTPLLAGAMGSVIEAWAMAADAAALYWLDNAGSVHAVPLGGGAATQLAVGLSNPRCPRLDTDTIYFISQEVPRILYRLPKAGGTPVVVESDGVTDLAVDGGWLYWARNETQTGTEVVRVPKAGGSEEILGFGGKLGVLNSIVVVGGTVFLLDMGAAQMGMGRILRL